MKTKDKIFIWIILLLFTFIVVQAPGWRGEEQRWQTTITALSYDRDTWSTWAVGYEKTVSSYRLTDYAETMALTSTEERVFTYDVPLYVQSDERWGSLPVGLGDPDTPCGKYHWTMRNSGCGITSMAMILNYFNDPVLPGDLNIWMKSHGGYQHDGCTISIWGIVKHNPGMFITQETYIAYEDGSLAKNRDSIISALKMYGPVLVGVVMWDGGISIGHVVVAYGYEGTDILIRDPWVDPNHMAGILTDDVAPIRFIMGFSK